MALGEVDVGEVLLGDVDAVSFEYDASDFGDAVVDPCAVFGDSGDFVVAFGFAVLEFAFFFEVGGDSGDCAGFLSAVPV